MSEVLLEVDPAVLIIGANVRTTTSPDDRQFAASVKSRGVLEAITCFRDEEGRLVVLRGQRRALVAARSGTPSGTVPVRVVDNPAEADRITDQLGENVHRTAMTDADVCGAVEQLALLGISAAQITKRVAIDRTRVDAALAVTKAHDARERLQRGMSLEDALVFAEFENDPDATVALAHAANEGHPLAHVAQQLRDNTEERLMIRTEISRLLADGVPVLEPAEVPVSLWRHRLDDLVRVDTGQPVTESEATTLHGASIVVTVENAADDVYPDQSAPEDADDTGADDAEDNQAEVPERLRVSHEWIVLDPEAAGLVPSWQWRQQHRADGASNASETADPEVDAEAERDAKREQRRLVIANNKAWDSAQVVRREWLASLCARRTPPSGAEELITAAVLLPDYNLSRAMTGHHQLLREWLGLEPRSWQSPDTLPGFLSEVRTPKHHLMLTLAAVLAAWEEGLSKESWRRPDPWNARCLTTICGWGYEPSPVENLMIFSDAATSSTDDSSEASSA